MSALRFFAKAAELLPLIAGFDDAYPPVEIFGPLIFGSTCFSTALARDFESIKLFTPVEMSV